MAINALLSPAAASTTVEGDPGKTPKDVGDAFAGVFAEAVGKAPNGADVPLIDAIPTVDPLILVASGSADLGQAVDPGLQSGQDTGTKPTRTGVTPQVASARIVETPPLPREVTGGKLSTEVESTADLSDAVPTLSSSEAEAEVETPKTKASAPRSPIARKGGVPLRKVDAPPDPPPATADPEKGAKTKAPNAPVERPDPISKQASEPEDSAFASFSVANPAPQALLAPLVVAWSRPPARRRPIPRSSHLSRRPLSCCRRAIRDDLLPRFRSLPSRRGKRHLRRLWPKTLRTTRRSPTALTPRPPRRERCPCRCSGAARRSRWCP